MNLSVKEFLVLAQKQPGINVFAATVQIAHETAFQGKIFNSELWLKAKNGAGIKATPDWQGEVYVKKSPEEIGGKWVEKVSTFRKYPSVSAFLADYAKKIANPRYALCQKNIDNWPGYFAGLVAGGWATDSAYFGKLIARAVALAPELLGAGWEDRFRSARDLAMQRKTLTATQLAILDKAIPAHSAQKNTTGKLVCLDAGHGHPDPGACGNGLKEADINLAVVLKTKTALEKRGLRVILTRDGSKRFEQKTDKAAKNRDLAKRPQVANDAGAHCFVSIHCNSAANPTARGWEIFTTPGQNNSDKLATCIHGEWKKQVGGSIRADLADGDADKEASFAVIRGTKCPSCLIELGFISNPQDAAQLRDPTWQSKAAEAIAEGVAKWSRA